MTNAKVVNKEEQAIKDKIQSLKKQIGDKVPSLAQTAILKDARNALGQLTFVRVANKRIPKVLKAIAGIGGLSGGTYVSTEPQRTAIIKALENAVQNASDKLKGEKKADSGFALPTA
jgi:hypothetical protein